jgi:hypothetical protein
MADLTARQLWRLFASIRSSYRAALRRNGEMTPEYLAHAAANEVERFAEMKRRG